MIVAISLREQEPGVDVTFSRSLISYMVAGVICLRKYCSALLLYDVEEV